MKRLTFVELLRSLDGEVAERFYRNTLKESKGKKELLGWTEMRMPKKDWLLITFDWEAADEGKGYWAELYNEMD